MSAVKERILGAVCVMGEADAENVWNYIRNHFSSDFWENIEEVAPDDWDLKMLDDISKSSDCKEFLSSKDALKELGL
mgnify:CR=1 FL=1